MLRSISATVMLRWSMRSIFMAGLPKKGTPRVPRPCRPAHSIIQNLDGVRVGVADIDRLDRADRPGARPRPGDDRHRATLEMLDDLAQRHIGDEAQIARARGRLVGDEARNGVGGVQVDLLLAEAQRRPPLAKANDLHPEYPRIKRAGPLDIGDGGEGVVETRDLHGSLRERCARDLPMAVQPTPSRRAAAPSGRS